MHLRLFRHFIPLSAIILALLDTLFIVCNLYYGYVVSLRSLESSFNIVNLLAHSAAFFWLVSVIVMMSIGLYASHKFATFSTLANKILIASALIIPISLVLAPYAHAGTTMGANPDFPLQTALIWFLWVTLTRGAFATGFELGILKRRILVLGGAEQAARIAKLVEASRKHPFVPVSYVELPGERPCVRTQGGVIVKGDLDRLVEWANTLRVSEIVVAAGERRGLPVRQLLHCKISGFKVTEFLDFWERETRTIDLQALRPSWLFYSDGFRCRLLDAVLKRAFDITVSLAVLLLTLPLQLLTACLIRLESPGPVFYRQERVGRYGRVFTILKFRSMGADAETDGQPRWAVEQDPRITRVGAVIRKLRIDELPQLINVLRGDMSFVGPRPERPLFVEQLSKDIPYYAERHWLRPGITGWAQINYPYGASLDDARHKLSYDLYYLKNVSIFLDFLILIQTLPVVLLRAGAR
jgi:sugar transferase (PEP-CTERM system associated)